MAEHKKSTVLYVDIIHTFEALSDDEAGRLIKHYLRYVNDLHPVAPDKLTQIAFEPIKQQLKRDLIKWEDTKSERSKSGQLGGVKSGEARRNKAKQNEANEANASNVKQNEANEAVNVTVNDNVIVNVKEDNTVLLRNRANSFKDSLLPFLEKYGRKILNEFYTYWTEPNHSKTKMKFELQKTWDTERRLNTWQKRDKNFNKQEIGKGEYMLQSLKEAKKILHGE